MALASISREIEELSNEAEDVFYNPLLFYGEGLDADISDEGEFANAISRLLPTLQHVSLRNGLQTCDILNRVLYVSILIKNVILYYYLYFRSQDSPTTALKLYLMLFHN